LGSPKHSIDCGIAAQKTKAVVSETVIGGKHLSRWPQLPVSEIAVAKQSEPAALLDQNMDMAQNG